MKRGAIGQRAPLRMCLRGQFLLEQTAEYFLKEPGIEWIVWRIPPRLLNAKQQQQQRKNGRRKKSEFWFLMKMYSVRSSVTHVCRDSRLNERHGMSWNASSRVWIICWVDEKVKRWVSHFAAFLCDGNDRLWTQSMALKIPFIWIGQGSFVICMLFVDKFFGRIDEDMRKCKQTHECAGEAATETTMCWATLELTS